MKKTHKKLRGKKLLMLEALKNQLGIITYACKQVGIHRDTHYNWLKTDEDYAYWFKEVELELKDFGELSLLKQMKEGNGTLIWNFNKTKNRDRGYGENQQIEHTGILPFTVQLIEKSPEEIKNETNNNKPETTGNDESSGGQ